MIPGRLTGVATLICGLLAAHAPPAADAQGSRPGGVKRIGRLSPLSAETDAPNLGAFRKGLGALGWVEGRDFVIETRFAEGKAERLSALAGELVRSGVDVILTGAHPGALAAKRATGTIPIVAVTTGDPVGGGLVESIARPGGNLTGVTALGQELNAKRLELLKQTLPGVTRLAVLTNPASPYTAPFLKERESIARTLGIQLRVVEARDSAMFEQAFMAMATRRTEALMVLTDLMFVNYRKRLAGLAIENRLPAMYGEREFVEAGGLMFYGASLVDMYSRAAVYVDRILKGAKPADLPVEQPTKLELVINLKAAKSLGVRIPPSVLARTDHLVE